MVVGESGSDRVTNEASYYNPGSYLEVPLRCGKLPRSESAAGVQISKSHQSFRNPSTITVGLNNMN